MTAPNYYAPDGYRYGVMFHDGSVANRWNGRTQQQQAEAHAAWCTEAVRGWAEARGRNTYIDTFTVVRHLPGQPWQPVRV